MTTPDAHEAAPATLPDIALSDLPETTKDFLIAMSAQGKTVADVIVGTLDQAAARHGFEPNKAA